MTSTELAALVESNIGTVQLGDCFPTERKLYTKLGLPKNTPANTAKKIVRGYFEWEKTNSLNKNRKTSNQICIIDIDYSFHYKDGRINNGGAHNETYIQFAKPLLLHHKYKYSALTTRQIAKGIYEFPENAFDDYENNAGVTTYLFELTSKLKSITKAALDSLLKEGLLRYEEVYMIAQSATNVSPFWQPEITYTENKIICSIPPDRSIDIEKDNIKRLILSIRPQLDECIFLEIEREICAKTNKPFSFDTATILDFTDIVVANEIDICGLFLEDETAETNYTIAEPMVQAFITCLERTMDEHLGSTPTQRRFNTQKRVNLQSRCDILWKILGWDYIYKAYSIHGINPREEKYPIGGDETEHLKATLEEFMVKAVNKKSISHENTHRSGFGNSSKVKTVRTYHYWLADSEKVKQRHRQIFNLSGESHIFREDTYESVVLSEDPTPMGCEDDLF